MHYATKTAYQPSRKVATNKGSGVLVEHYSAKVGGLVRRTKSPRKQPGDYVGQHLHAPSFFFKTNNNNNINYKRNNFHTLTSPTGTG